MLQEKIRLKLHDFKAGENMDDLSIVICTINRNKYLNNLLNYLKNKLNNKISIIIVDDGSTDGTENTVKYYADKMRISYIYQKKEEYSSPAHARNVGWKSADAKYISFTDPEIVIPPNTIQLCYDYHQANPKSITALKPIMMDEAETEVFFSLSEPYEWLYNRKEFSDSENIQIQNRKSWRDNHFSMMPKQALVDVDGVNENFTSWGFEGIDLIERIIEKGYQLYNFKGVYVYHLWHSVNRNMDLANQQRKVYGVKNCGLTD